MKARAADEGAEATEESVEASKLEIECAGIGSKLGSQEGACARAGCPASRTELLDSSPDGPTETAEPTALELRAQHWLRERRRTEERVRSSRCFSGK